MTRKPVHFALVALAYFAAGVVLTVGVAWGIAAWVQVPEKSAQRFDQPREIAHWRVPEAWPRLVYTATGRSTGIGAEMAFYSNEPSEPLVIGISQLTATGFPWLAMRWELWVEPVAKVASRTSRPAIRIPDALRPRRLQGQMVWLPVTPCWGGLVADAALYGFLLWGGAFAIRSARRTWRVRRGLCPRCAYPMGVAERCTECGEPLGGKQQMGKAANQQMSRSEGAALAGSVEERGTS